MSEGFIDFLTASPSSYHAAETGGQLLEEAGFHRHQETQPWDVTPGGHFIIRGGALMAWYIPSELHNPAFRIIGAHTDSPGFKLKHTATYTSSGFNQAAVEVYGGPIISSWFDRDLRLAGQLSLIDGTTSLLSTPPLLRIPNLAIHLDRDPQRDRQLHTAPIYGVGLGASTSFVPEEAVTYDLITVDAQPPQTLGIDNNLLAAGRLDNLSSVYPGIQALIAASADATDILVLACFDHEEVGSASTTGAAGPILQDILERTTHALGASLEETKQIYRRSSCVSADAAHSIHPNYPSYHDPHNHPLLGAGPVLKINANQRYASTHETEALWLRACPQSQHFVGNNSVPCGSTIGPITATRLGIPTVDVGIPLLSMHSARELCHLDDVETFTHVLTNYLVG